MIYTILMYSLFTCISAFAVNWEQLAITRFLVAMGVGGEWAVASGVVAGKSFLRAPCAARWAFFTVPACWAAYGGVATAGSLPVLGWRVILRRRALPALLTIWVRYSIREPESWPKRQAERSRRRSEKWAAYATCSLRNHP